MDWFSFYEKLTTDHPSKFLRTWIRVVYPAAVSSPSPARLQQNNSHPHWTPTHMQPLVPRGVVHLPWLLVVRGKISCCIASAWSPASRSSPAAEDPAWPFPAAAWAWPRRTCGPRPRRAASSSSLVWFAPRRGHLKVRGDSRCSISQLRGYISFSCYSLLMSKYSGIYIFYIFDPFGKRTTHTAPACRPPDTCAGDTAGTCGACTCPSHSARCSCRSTGHSWWRCGGRSPCSLHSSTRCNGNPRPCHHRRCTPHCPASSEPAPSSSSRADHLHTWRGGGR